MGSTSLGHVVEDQSTMTPQDGLAPVGGGRMASKPRARADGQQQRPTTEDNSASSEFSRRGEFFSPLSLSHSLSLSFLRKHANYKDTKTYETHFYCFFTVGPYVA